MKKHSLLQLALLLLLACSAYACSDGNKNNSTNAAETPVSNLSAGAGNTATDNPAQDAPQGFVSLPLTEHFSYVGQGFIHVYGTVKNTSGQWIANVRLQINLYDAQGKALHAENFMEDEFRSNSSDDVVCDITCIPPGAEIPFEYLRDLKRINGNYASHKITAAGKPGQKAETVQLSNTKVVPDGSYQAFSGVATVTGHCKWPYVAAVGYDANGKIVSLRTYSIYLKPNAEAQDPSYDEMKPGQTGYFSGNMENPTNDDGKVLAQISSIKFIGYYGCESE